MGFQEQAAAPVCSDTEASTTISNATKFIEAVRSKLKKDQVSKFDEEVLSPYRLPTKWDQDLNSKELADKSDCNKLNIAMSNEKVAKFVTAAKEAIKDGKLDKKAVEAAAKEFSSN